MKRRHFISLSALGASSIVGFSLPACQNQTISETKKLNQEDFNTFAFNEKSITELQEMMKSDQLNSEELVIAYLERVEKIDKNGPTTNSIIEINSDALAIARTLDKERKAGKLRGPIHGIPILLKDNIDTADKMMTTAGSLAMEGNFAAKDAFIVEQLRKSGAIILGKTNLSEWANFRSTRSSSGWSGRGGQTHNPYVIDRSPCGSSSGSAVAVAANMCVVALGTETDGSIVCPSGHNGVVGIKPSLGLVSRSGIIPIAHSQDTAGPIARSVQDAAILLTVICGKDTNDSISLHEKNSGINYAENLSKEALKGARIGVVRELFGFHAEVDKIMEQAIEDLKHTGAILVDVELENIHQYANEEFEVLLYEFKHDLNNYLNNCKFPIVKSLEDIIHFNEQYKHLEMPWFEQEIMEMANLKGDLTETKYLEALAKCKELSGKKGINASIEKYRIDALIAPTNGPAWNIDLVNGDHYGGGSSAPAAVSGYPNITVPAGFIHSLPIGISFFAEAFSEQKLIQYAYAYEQATKHRKSPEFYSSIMQ
ncbi:amidase [Labilibaculum filiforme]|uniref:Amidase n=1 Tax=Labilibaculum filiforme TaxID=1940526 RepID=A0A2N3HVC3_9BACT|nr:amidase [Labilibaculum filiforme]PKQ62002.1 amidase [Labilibaculum filiforme]